MKSLLAVIATRLDVARRAWARPFVYMSIPRALGVVVPLCLLLAFAALGVYAQTIGAQSVEDTAQSLFQTFYTKWRWPICGLALIPAGWQWFSSDPRGKSRALSICAGILVWALIPYFIALFRVVTNS
ncbi:MAG: hypothetical protein M3458_08630 [Acidobacteriota bacterium]|nr:hypothetical protein [Acidobacteriota bacterium]